MSEPSTSDILGALSSPLPGDPSSVSRRRFLQAVGAGTAVAAMPSFLAEPAAAATPAGRTDGVLVLLTMGGGNDGLNTFIPTGDGAYHDARKSLAIGPGQAIDLGGGRGLNPNLPFVKTLWDQGRVAVVDGVGHRGSTLSHFVSMASVMAATVERPPYNTGWLGRFLDEVGNNPFTGLSLGGAVPLLMKGRTRNAVGLPDEGKHILRTTDIEPTYARQNAAIRNFGVGPSGLGPMGDQVAAAGRRAVDYAATIAPMFDDRDDEPRFVTKMRLAARLINADLGVRVISIVFGDFDSHANQQSMHRNRMREIDAGLKTFYNTLNVDRAGRTLIVGTSEFGRRVQFNGSGTDHGTANSLFAIGNGVRPGFHGRQPSLRQLDRNDNPIPTVDLMAFYATIATTWLGADDATLLGRNYENLGFLNRPARTGGTSRSGVTPTASIRERRARVARVYLALTGGLPSESSFEKMAASHISGRRTLAEVATAVATSTPFTAAHANPDDRQFVNLVYRAIRGWAANANEQANWLQRLSSGASRGEVVASLLATKSASSDFVKKTEPVILNMEMTGPVGRLYHAYFLRPPAVKGLNYWINTGATLPTISDHFATSAEFKSRYGPLNNRQFVALIYRNVLGREAADQGLDYWTSLLDRGRSRGQVMVEFSNSEEFRRKIKNQ